MECSNTFRTILVDMNTISVNEIYKIIEKKFNIQHCSFIIKFIDDENDSIALIDDDDLKYALFLQERYFPILKLTIHLRNE